MSSTVSRARMTIGVSLKMYFGRQETVAWCTDVAKIALAHPEVRDGSIELFVLPSAPLIKEAVEILGPTPVGVGAQDLSAHNEGPFTGEVSGSMLRELECAYVEVGHAERRALFGEDNRTVAAKVTAALRNELTPILCVGESLNGPAEERLETCIEELDAVLGAVHHEEPMNPIVAYEPVWAIGRSGPAPPRHIAAVTHGLTAWLSHRDNVESFRVIYGGSANVGLLGKLVGVVDGLFLGRFAHDPRVLAAILDEAAVAMKHEAEGS